MQDLKVTIIQTDLVWENIAANLANLEKQLQTISEPTDLILLPEMFTTGFSMKSEVLAETIDGKTMQWMARQAQKHNAVIAGSLMIKDKGNYYNRLIWMRPNCSYEFYDKRHLFAMSGEHEYFKAGENRLIVELKGWKICPMICYDLRFPIWSRNTEDYDLLLYVANWPTQRIAHWQTLLTARAIENQSYTIGVNRIGTDIYGTYYSGHSAIIDMLGVTLFEKTHQPAVHTQTLSKIYLNKIRESLPFLKDRD
jgi:predicted amidohydrolase